MGKKHLYISLISTIIVVLITSFFMLRASANTISFSETRNPGFAVWENTQSANWSYETALVTGENKVFTINDYDYKNWDIGIVMIAHQKPTSFIDPDTGQTRTIGSKDTLTLKTVTPSGHTGFTTSQVEIFDNNPNNGYVSVRVKDLRLYGTGMYMEKLNEENKGIIVSQDRYTENWHIKMNLEWEVDLFEEPAPENINAIATGPASVEVGETLELHGNDSTSSGTIVEWRWYGYNTGVKTELNSSYYEGTDSPNLVRNNTIGLSTSQNQTYLLEIKDSNGLSDTDTHTVIVTDENAGETNLRVAPTKLTVKSGEISEQFDAYYTPPTSSYDLLVTDDAIWTSLNRDIATSLGKGRYRGNKVGQTLIQAEYSDEWDEVYGLTATAILEVTPGLPEAHITAPTTAFTWEEITLDGSASFSRGGNIIEYNWKINGVEYGKGKSIDLTFEEQGNYEIELMVRDEFDQTDTTSTRIEVTPALPQAIITGPGWAFMWEEITLDGSGSFSYDGEIVEHKWKIDGVEYAEGEFINFIFEEERNYLVELTVRDEFNQTDTAYTNIVVIASTPVAIINGPTTVFMWEEITLDGSSSWSNGGAIVEHKWKINGVEYQESEIIQLMYEKEGIYEIELTVRDVFKQTDTTSITLEILPDYPIAHFEYDDRYLKENRRITLDASTSVGSEHTGRFEVDHSKTEWEIIPLEGQDPNGIFTKQEVEGSNKVIHLLVREEGNYMIRNRVENEMGDKSLEWYELNEPIKIEPDLRPEANFTVQPVIYRHSDTRKATAILTDYLSKSLDNDLIQQRIWHYRYDSNNDGNFEDEEWVLIDEQNKHELSLIVDHVGYYEVRLEIVEAFGQPTIPEFLNANLYKRDTVTRAFKVDNKAPTVDWGSPN